MPLLDRSLLNRKINLQSGGGVCSLGFAGTQSAIGEAQPQRPAKRGAVLVRSVRGFGRAAAGLRHSRAP